jgi:hypothetical protein
MPNRKCCTILIALLLGGFSLGTSSRGDEYEGYRESTPAQAQPGFVRFRGSVFLREGGAPQVKPHARAHQRISREYAIRVPIRRALPAPARLPVPARTVAGGSQLWLQPTSFTPYDRYMGTVRSVINHLETHPANMSLACQLMEEGRHFQYVTADPYTANPPRVTEMVQAGDCKAKALWLYNCLGDANALFVIGKTTRGSHTSHAWVYWRNENRWWILDCTNRSQPILADSVPQDRYVPYYSYGRSGTYRHQATRLLITPGNSDSGEAAVAAQTGR